MSCGSKLFSSVGAFFVLFLSTSVWSGEAPYDWGTTGVSDTEKVKNILQITDNIYGDSPLDRSNPQYSFGPLAWNKSGEWIVYTSSIGSNTDTDRDICIIKSDGSGFKNLTENNGVEDSNASFGSDGKVYFQRNVTSVGYNIFRINTDGSGEENLTAAHLGSAGEHDVRPSPDATKIAYRYNSRLFVADSEGTKTQVSQENPFINIDTTDGEQVDWSPESDWLVYVGTNSQNETRLFKVNPAGTIHDQITSPQTTTDDYRPAWSPDSEKIAFKRRNDDGSRQLIIINPDGTGSNELDKSLSGDNWTLDPYGPISWSPDSKWIAYRKDSSTPTYRAIFIVNVTTEEKFQLTKDFYDYAPLWSPAGNQILIVDNSYNSSRDDSDDLGEGTNNDADMLILNLIGEYGGAQFPWHMFLPAVQNNGK